MIEYKRYTIKELSDFIDSDQYRDSAVLPISKHRALSYIKNPRADLNDVVMYIAEENGKIIAYKLMLPDTLYVNDERHKVAWFSCIYVSNSHRSKGIGKRMNEMTWDDWKGKILYHHPAKASSTMYKSSGKFKMVSQPLGLRCFYRINLVDYWKSRKRTNALIPVIRLLQHITNAMLSIRGFLTSSYELKEEYKISLVDEMSPELKSFIENHSNKGPMNRSAIELEWIKKYPWILESDTNPIGDKYYFSAYEPEFKSHWVTMKSEEDIVGFLNYTVKNGHLKVLYVLANENELKSICEFLFIEVQKNKYKTLTVFDPKIVDKLSKGNHPFWLIRKKTRPLYASNSMWELLNPNFPVFQAGDGDNAFT